MRSVPDATSPPVATSRFRSTSRTTNPQHARRGQRRDDSMSTTKVTIYGASDDLIEVYGEIEGADEFGVYRSEWVGTLTSPDGESLIVRGEYGKPGARGDWTLSIENTESYPAWPI